MELDSVTCTECGASDWSKLFDKDYPERRKERERTVQTVYMCQECGAEGKHFEHRQSGTEQRTGAMRA